MIKVKKSDIILFVTFIICSLIYLYTSNSNINYKPEIIIKKSNKEIIKEIEKENKNNKLIKKENYNGITYYLYSNDTGLTSYFVDSKNKKITDIYSIINDKENFDKKINELLNLKYPKFVADSINESSDKTFEIRDNELVIYYTNLKIELDQSVSLKVNYNEIKDYLKIKYKLDAEYENENGYNYDPNKKTIAFTFDDGPGGKYTLDILNSLSENKAHATFFMLGNRMNNYDTIVTTVHNSGNEIGSHTLSHYNMGKTKLNKILEREEQTDQIYNNLTGDTLKLMRPPYGIITNKQKEKLEKIIVTWSIDTLDWKTKNKEMIKEEILNNAKDGEIVLMHDIYPTTAEAVKEVLPLLYAKGFQVVSVSELANLKNRTLEPHNVYYRIKPTE